MIDISGQTECSAICSCTLETDLTTGHTGVPLFCNQIKLVDVPELDYYVMDGVTLVFLLFLKVVNGFYPKVIVSRSET